MCNAAVLAEIFRAGVNALPKGQLEASLAVGLTYWQAMRLVIFPQAIRLIIPALVTQLVSLLKDSTLGYAASFPELLRTANVLTARTHTLIQVYIVISLIYVIINLALSYLARVLERRLNRTRVQRPRHRAARGRRGRDGAADGDRRRRCDHTSRPALGCGYQRRSCARERSAA